MPTTSPRAARVKQSARGAARVVLVAVLAAAVATAPAPPATAAAAPAAHSALAQAPVATYTVTGALPYGYGEHYAPLTVWTDISASRSWYRSVPLSKSGRFSFELPRGRYTLSFGNGDPYWLGGATNPRDAQWFTVSGGDVALGSIPAADWGFIEISASSIRPADVESVTLHTYSATGDPVVLGTTAVPRNGLPLRVLSGQVYSAWVEARGHVGAWAVTADGAREVTAGWSSAPVLHAQLTPIVESARPAVTGTPEVGKTLKASVKGWQSGAAFTYRWLANGTTIPGATGTSLSLTTALAGKRVSLQVTGRVAGHRESIQTSAATLPVLKTYAPRVIGTPVLGQTLSYRVKDWKPLTGWHLRWFADGKAIKGADKATLKVTRSLVGKKITVRITGTPDSRPSISLYSPPTLRAAGWTKPRITGTKKVGHTVRAVTGKWTPGAKLTYQWYVDGRIIRGATKASLTLKNAQRGLPISVRVTAKKSGHPAVTKVSSRYVVAR